MLVPFVCVPVSTKHQPRNFNHLFTDELSILVARSFSTDLHVDGQNIRLK